MLSPVMASAATVGEMINKNIEDVGADAGFKKGLELPNLVGLIINILLSILGVIFVILIVYSGVIWMTSYGNEQKITRAKETIIAAVIGLIIVMAAYAITRFVVNALVKAAVS